MNTPVLYGTPLSTFVRTARMLLSEKGADYDLVDVGVLNHETLQPEHLARHPFGKVPVLDHDGARYYETTAVIRYLDQVLEGPSLTPADPKAQARMNQIIGIIDAYGYDALVLGIAAHYLFPDFIGGSDDAKLAAATEQSRRVLGEIERIMNGAEYLAGDALSLADLYLAPCLFYVSITPAFDVLMSDLPTLSRWWAGMNARQSYTDTMPPLG